MSRVRLDVLLVERGLAESRQKAQALIMAGLVSVGEQFAQKAGQLVPEAAKVSVRKPQPFVSRGGYKLACALESFRLDVVDCVVVDVGASTGGFTDVLLQRGARRVYAVDVGRGQLHSRLQNDRRVVVLDRTNIRHLACLPERPSLATVDVSFISLRLVIPAVLRLVAPGSSMIVLVKPQFEAGRGEVGRGGVVRSSSVHRRVLSEFGGWLPTQGLEMCGLVRSPIKGPAGNAEFLAWLCPVAADAPPAADLIESVLDGDATNTQTESAAR